MKLDSVLEKEETKVQKGKEVKGEKDAESAKIDLKARQSRVVKEKDVKGKKEAEKDPSTGKELKARQILKVRESLRFHKFLTLIVRKS